MGLIRVGVQPSPTELSQYPAEMTQMVNLGGKMDDWVKHGEHGGLEGLPIQWGK